MRGGTPDTPTQRRQGYGAKTPQSSQAPTLRLIGRIIARTAKGVAREREIKILRLVRMVGIYLMSESSNKTPQAIVSLTKTPRARRRQSREAAKRGHVLTHLSGAL
jgi:hypothetical protein